MNSNKHADRFTKKTPTAPILSGEEPTFVFAHVGGVRLSEGKTVPPIGLKSTLGERIASSEPHPTSSAGSYQHLAQTSERPASGILVRKERLHAAEVNRRHYDDLL